MSKPIQISIYHLKKRKSIIVNDGIQYHELHNLAVKAFYPNLNSSTEEEEYYLALLGSSKETTPFALCNKSEFILLKYGDLHKTLDEKLEEEYKKNLL